MNKEMRRKIIAVISSYIVVLSCYVSSCHKDNRVIINSSYEYKSESPFAYYKGGNIYICNNDTIIKIRNDKTNDIYIMDQRYGIDPNMKICNSYEIINPIEMNRIINVLFEYDKQYPSAWNRTRISMLLEWLGHDASYYCGFETNRTSEVDLNNNDENKYLTLNKK